MDYVQPSIYLFNVRIDEPVTVLTDLILGFVCLYAFRRLKRQNIGKQAFVQFRLFFLFIGLSTILGGLFGHGFLYNFNQVWHHPEWLDKIVDSSEVLIPIKPYYIFKLPGWLCGIYAIYLFQQGMVHWFSDQLKPGITRLLLGLNLVEAITATGFVLLTFNFLYVVLHIVYGLLLVICTLHVYMYLKQKKASSLLMIAAVVTMIIAGLIHATKFGFSEWFNHRDVNHVIMTFSIYLFLRGIEMLIKEYNERRLDDHRDIKQN